ncbi:DAPG hydrolase family protein [Tannockella kyphosi]|uniref:DAPG hydrolase family protein n=1 Tax=Tannockella kyphosi TaxID=2899121 RepID=UPI0020138D8C|nr:hypothetical protein [Tannockella kyphosi]
MNLDKYMSMKNCDIPKDIKQNIYNGNITKTQFKDKNDILEKEELRLECGCVKMDDESYLVSMYTPMPDVTKEMVSWWFWWHPQNSKRYQAWYPGEHKSISYAKKDLGYFQQKTTPEFQPNTQYPVERVGSLLAPLSIEFVQPNEFGFSKNIMEKQDVEVIICGHVGAFKGLIPNTEMSHVFFKTEKGLLLVSRFWLGKNVKNKILKKLLLTQKQAQGMADHCCVEYRNFNERIPLMYQEWLQDNA